MAPPKLLLMAQPLKHPQSESVLVCLLGLIYHIWFKMSAVSSRMHALSGARHRSIDASIVPCLLLCQIFKAQFQSVEHFVFATKVHRNWEQIIWQRWPRPLFTKLTKM